MDNNDAKFDPITGEPINNKTEVQQSESTVNQNISTDLEINQNQSTDTASVQKNLQSIATVDQSNENFINNAQTESNEKVESSDGKMNFTFIIILFALIFAAIFFLFPIISKYI